MSSDRRTPRTRLFGPAVVLGLVLAHAAGAAAAARVAVVKSSGIPPFEQAAAAFTAALRADALQPEILTFDLKGEREAAVSVMEQLRDRPPALIVSIGSLATAAMLAQPSTIPVVFSMVLYPRESGFLDRPDREVTGASLDVPLADQFRYLKRLVPLATRVGVLYHPEETGSVVEAARGAATALGMRLVAAEVANSAEVLPSLERMLPSIDVLWTVADSHVLTAHTAAPLLLAALAGGVPTIGLSPAHVRSGALAALSCDYADVGRQTAEVVLRVLRGERAGAIPPTTPRSVSLSLNLRTAAHLGLDVADDVRREATEVTP